MSLEKCTGTSGFPLIIDKPVNSSNWTNYNSSITIQPFETDLTYQPNALPYTVTINKGTQTNNTFQILIESASSTTLVYENVPYQMNSIISIVPNLHSSFNNTSKNNYEIIIEFTIKDISLNPTLPRLILICRPIRFSTSSDKSSILDSVINKYNNPTSNTSVTLNVSNLIGWNSSTLYPMIAYNTCIDASKSNQDASINTRVYVCLKILSVYNNADTYPNLSKYQISQNIINTFFSGKNITSKSISDISTIKDYASLYSAIQVQVPKFMVGDSLTKVLSSDIEDLPTYATNIKGSSGNTKYKCYTIDPLHDIDSNGNILIDPKTGAPLTTNQLKEEGLLAPTTGSIDIGSSGLMPGDIENIVSIICITIGTILLLAYAGYIAHMLFITKDINIGLFNVACFIVLFVCLILFGVFYGNEKAA
jgi:hypothetical protein